ncbi:MAG: hypothetical protein J1F11_00600 [Oscillospiraceae bacterium]|nr:hypothetical protein [Oscillospiraceae bacterium]
MDSKKILKSTQEQASAAWIDHLNQLRLDRLIEKLTQQDINLLEALEELDELKRFVGDPSHILGNPDTKHGEIAEHIQVNISNARNLIKGLASEYTFDGVGRTAPEDYLKNGQPIQSKFINGAENTLNHIKKHLLKYPDFINDGGAYDIPKDQYEEISRVIKLANESPSLLSKEDWSLLNKVKQFENDTGLSISKNLNSSIAKYDEVQKGKVSETISKEESNIKKEDQNQRDKAYEASKPTLKEGAKATVISAALEGSVSFCLAVREKLKSGKKLNEFTAEDWKEIGLTTGIDTAKGGIRGASVYALTNFTATPANVASALVTAAFGVVSQANELRKGNIDNEEFIINSETVCLDVSISAIASVLGQVAIPIPVLGAMIGNAAGMFMYGIAKECCLEKEQQCIQEHNIAIDKLNAQLDDEYRKLVEFLMEKFKEFKSAVDLAFDIDINIAFDGSIKLAELVGVDSSRILRSQEDIYNYFTM